MDLLQLFNTFGIPGLIIYFIYQSQRREERLEKRIESLEEYQRNRLEHLTQQTLEMLKYVSNITSSLVSIWKSRKCLADVEITREQHKTD